MNIFSRPIWLYFAKNKILFRLVLYRLKMIHGRIFRYHSNPGLKYKLRYVTATSFPSRFIFFPFFWKNGMRNKTNRYIDVAYLTSLQSYLVCFSFKVSSAHLPLFLLLSSRSEYFKRQNVCLLPCQQPYHVEHTSSRPITEVKQHWARIVLGWETAWEHRVLLAFFCQSFRILCLLFCPILFVSVSKSALCTFLFFCYARVGGSTLRGKMFAFLKMTVWTTTTFS